MIAGYTVFAGSFLDAVERSEALARADLLSLSVVKLKISGERAAEKTLSNCPPMKDGIEVKRPSRISKAAVTVFCEASAAMNKAC